MGQHRRAAKLRAKLMAKLRTKIEGKAEGLNLAGEIIKRKKHGESPAAIARALNIEQTEVSICCATFRK